MILITKTPDQTRLRGDTLSLLVQFLLKRCVPCAFPLLPIYSLDYLGWQLLNQPFLVYVFPSFHSSLLRFPNGVYNSCAVSCASSPLFRPPRSRPCSCPRIYPRPRSHLRYCSRFRPHSPVPFPFLCWSTGLHPRSRPRSRAVPTLTLVTILRSLVRLHPVLVPVPAPSPFPPPTPLPSPSYVRPRVSTPVPVSAPAPSPLPSLFLSCVPLFAFISVPAPVPAPAPSPSPFTSPFPPPFPSPFPPPTMFTPARPSDLVTPPLRCACTGTGPCKRNCRVSCRDDDACGMKVPDCVYNSCAISCASSPLLHVPRPRPSSCPPPPPLFPIPMSATALVSIPAPVPVPILCSSTGLHPRPRFRSRPVPAPVPAPVPVSARRKMKPHLPLGQCCIMFES